MTRAAANHSAVFRTRLLSAGKTATGIEVPDAIVEQFGRGKRPAVKITINGHTWQSTVAVMGGRYLLGVPAQHRAAARVAAGDSVKVTLVLDDGPRTTPVPKDLAEALAAAGATEAFDRLAPSYRKEHVRAVEEAKKPETRARRIAKIVAALS